MFQNFKKNYYCDENLFFLFLFNKELFILYIIIMIFFLNDKCYIMLMFVNLNVYNVILEYNLVEV